AVLELLHPARVAGHAALARRQVARRQVVHDELQLIAREASGYPLRLAGIRKLELDRIEAGRPRRREAVKEAELGEERAQVGGEFGHGRARMLSARYRNTRGRNAPRERNRAAANAVPGGN